VRDLENCLRFGAAADVPAYQAAGGGMTIAKAISRSHDGVAIQG
jgi:hypothetical protein